MRLRRVCLVIALAAMCGCSQMKELNTTMQSTGGYFHQGKQKTVTMEVTYSPNPVRPSRSGGMDVTVAIVNNTKVQQTFGTQTEQRIGVQIRDISTGSVVATMQEGRSEDPHLTSPLLNPGERLTFERRLPTNNLRAGQTYQIEAFVVGSEQTMHGETQFVPQ